MEGSGVDETLGVDAGVVDEEEVVAVGLVNEVEADKGEAENERCDTGVCQGCGGLSVYALLY